jgi:4-amino-4-deoxy-L-arabinose transferase-like glycosyltransferase
LALGTTRARLGVGVFALAALLYLPTLDHAWLNYDDDVYITANPEQLRGLTPDGVVWAFTSFHGANWFPLTRLSWALDQEIFGLSAAGFHATNALLHASSALLLFLALARLTGSAGRSAFVAAVFAVHPLHVESVAWAAARKDPLSALFFMAALWIYARRGREGPSPRTQLALFACLTLGLLAKPIVASLPAVLLLLDAWPLGRLRRPPAGVGIRRAVVEKLPLLALVAGFAFVAVAAQRAGGAVAPVAQLPLGARVENALVSYALYVAKAFWPTGLAVFYPHRADAIPFREVVAATLALTGATALALASARRRPYLAVGWLWYGVTLLPAIGLIQVGSQAMADRYMYLPLIGLTIAVAWGACDLAGSVPRARRVLSAAAVAALALLSIVSVFQLRHWRDSEALFRHALDVTRRNAVAHAYLGAALLERGRVDETLRHYRRAVEVEPSFLRATNNLAWLLATLPDESQRDPRAALTLARRAARQTGYGDPAVLDTLAAAHASLARFDDAVRTAERGLALAEAGADTGLAEGIAARLELYRVGRPYREAADRRRASR